ncbi:MAG: hypothetical protein IPK75_05440 [Acidobacteria bacterium]|jgi:hypothetical protein|nr:hypothetical protein [Acidobacteriota bacterium]
MRIFWPHWVGSAVCIALFAWQLAFVFPDRPREPDPVKGYTIEFELQPEAVYVSALDLTLIFGIFLTGMAITAFGLWRVQNAQKIPAK